MWPFPGLSSLSGPPCMGAGPRCLSWGPHISPRAWAEITEKDQSLQSLQERKARVAVGQCPLAQGSLAGCRAGYRCVVPGTGGSLLCPIPKGSSWGWNRIWRLRAQPGARRRADGIPGWDQVEPWGEGEVPTQDVPACLAPWSPRPGSWLQNPSPTWAWQWWTVEIRGEKQCCVSSSLLSPWVSGDSF